MQVFRALLICARSAGLILLFTMATPALPLDDCDNEEERDLTVIVNITVLAIVYTYRQTRASVGQKCVLCAV